MSNTAQIKEEIVELLLDGDSHKEIARAYGISEHIVMKIAYAEIVKETARANRRADIAEEELNDIKHSYKMSVIDVVGKVNKVINPLMATGIAAFKAAAKRSKDRRAQRI